MRMSFPLEKAGRPTRALIDLAALRHNHEQIVRAAGRGREVMAVVKADAYGHGAVPVAKELSGAGVGLFAVAMIEEARSLRDAGLGEPILILGQTYPGQERELLTRKLTPVLFDFDLLERLENTARNLQVEVPVHVKLDTGMGRVGFSAGQLPRLLERLRSSKHLLVEGVMSHMPVADELSNSFNQRQCHLFGQSLTSFRQAGISPRYIHIGNSAALFSLDLPEVNLVRPGISLYGGLPGPEFAGRLDLKPVMRLESAIVALKEVPAGTGISYGHRFVTSRSSRVATIPVGYADGFNRLFTNKGEVLLHGRRVPVVGTVCMDWIMLDVTDLPEASVGDMVTLLGRDGDEQITAEEWGEKLDTINYEVFCRIGSRVPRFYPDSL